MAVSRPDVESSGRDVALATALRRSADRILRRWTGLQDAGGDNESASGHLLAGDPARVLEAIIDRIESGRLEGKQDQPVRPEGIAPSIRGDHPIAPIIRSYGLLRRAVIEQADRELGPVSAGQMTLIAAAVDAEMAQRLGSVVEGRMDELHVAAEAQGKYMSYLSHDLRGSLNGAVLMLEVLKREMEDHPEMTESLADLSLVRRSILDTVTVMERHLFIDRLRRGKIVPQRQPMELIQVVEEVVGQYDAAAKAKGDPWLVDVPGEALVQADPSLVSSALQALVDNAVKHGSRGLIRITARPGDDGPAGMWILAVGDAGPGIEPLRLGILMDPVKRMEMKERGLGLSTAHYAVQLCGGRLEASSRPGEGSSFRLILPRADR